MVRIAPIRLAYNPKTLWFDPGDLELKKEDPVVVSTARGLEFGRMADDVFEADEAQVKKLKTALKPVKRLASEEDVARAEEMCRRSEEALPVFKQMAAEPSEDMHPVSVEFLLDGDKAVFYFEAEERVDFRELVRKLAAHFHVRIDMRQIGVRDEARMVGGLGHCGQELCCKRLGGEFCPVSIRMAKEQDLSLNPQKISGVCGRLMCCLRYEFDAYKDFKSRAPKQNSQVETPAGMAKVVDLDVPREIVSLKVEGEKPVKVPLADFEPPDEGSNRPNRVGQDAWDDRGVAVQAQAEAGRRDGLRRRKEAGFEEGRQRRPGRRQRRQEGLRLPERPGTQWRRADRRRPRRRGQERQEAGREGRPGRCQAGPASRPALVRPAPAGRRGLRVGRSRGRAGRRGRTPPGAPPQPQGRRPAGGPGWRRGRQGRVAGCSGRRPAPLAVPPGRCRHRNADGTPHA